MPFCSKWLIRGLTRIIFRPTKINTPNVPVVWSHSPSKSLLYFWTVVMFHVRKHALLVDTVPSVINQGGPSSENRSVRFSNTTTRIYKRRHTNLTTSASWRRQELERDKLYKTCMEGRLSLSYWTGARISNTFFKRLETTLELSWMERPSSTTESKLRGYVTSKAWDLRLMMGHLRG